jgi:hypothetical protein
LRDARLYRHLVGVLAIEDNSHSPSCQKAPYPLQRGAVDAVVGQLVEELGMWHGVKRLAEVEYREVNLGAFVVGT